MQSYFLSNFLLSALKNCNINLRSGEVLQVKRGLMDLHHCFETFTPRWTSSVRVFSFPGESSCRGPVYYMRGTNYNSIISLLFLSALERAPVPNCTVTLLECSGASWLDRG